MILSIARHSCACDFCRCRSVRRRPLRRACRSRLSSRTCSCRCSPNGRGSTPNVLRRLSQACCCSDQLIFYLRRTCLFLSGIDVLGQVALDPRSGAWRSKSKNLLGDWSLANLAARASTRRSDHHAPLLSTTSIQTRRPPVVFFFLRPCSSSLNANHF